MTYTISGCAGCYWLGNSCEIRKALWKAMESQAPKNKDMVIEVKICASRQKS